jgi:hypothetical protein
VRCIVHVGAARLGLPPLEPPWPEGSAKASQRNGIPEVGVPKRLSGSESAHPASANQTLLRCGADRTNQSPDFRLTGSTRQSLRIARLLVWERITTHVTARALSSAVVRASVKTTFAT